MGKAVGVDSISRCLKGYMKKSSKRKIMFMFLQNQENCAQELLFKNYTCLLSLSNMRIYRHVSDFVRNYVIIFILL